MAIIKVVAFDPSIRNFGMARAVVDSKTLEIVATDLKLIETDKQTTKLVRQSSDDMRRSRQIYEGMVAWCEGATVAIAEIPHGAQSARAALSNGLCVGILAACPLPMIEVQASEVKKTVTGHKNASKEEMIGWATTLYPVIPWLKQAGRLVAKNEHLADAVAIIHAGVATQQFKQLASILAATAVSQS